MGEHTEEIEEGIEHLENIEKELKEIKQRTGGGGRWSALRSGIWQGIGAILGSIIAIALLGFVLSLLGVIPGFKEASQYLQTTVEEARHR